MAVTFNPTVSNGNRGAHFVAPLDPGGSAIRWSVDVIRPAITVQISQVNTLGYDLTFEWSTDQTFTTVDHTDNTTHTAVVGAWPAIPAYTVAPPADLGPAGTTWYLRAQIEDLDDSVVDVSLIVELGFYDPVGTANPTTEPGDRRVLYQFTNNGVGFCFQDPLVGANHSDEAKAQDVTAGSISPNLGGLTFVDYRCPEGNVVEDRRVLYHFTNNGVGFGFVDPNAGPNHPDETNAYDETAGSVTPNLGGLNTIDYRAPESDVTALSHVLYHYEQVDNSPPCPFIFAVEPDTVQPGDAFTVRGQGISNNSEVIIPSGGGTPTAADDPFPSQGGRHWYEDPQGTSGAMIEGTDLPADRICAGNNDQSDIQVILYSLPGCAGTSEPLIISNYAAGNTEDVITVQVPLTVVDSGFVGVNAIDACRTGTGMNSVVCGCADSTPFLTIIGEFAADPDAGWWIENWTRDGFGKNIDTVRVVKASFTKVRNGVGKGSMTVPAHYFEDLDNDGIPEDVIPTYIIDADPRDPVTGVRDILNPPQTSINRVYLHGVLRYAFWSETISRPYEYQGEQVVDISGDGIEAVLERMAVLPADYPALPTVAGDYQFANVTAGVIARTVQNTIGFPLFGFAPTYTDTLGSDGNAWAANLFTTIRRALNLRQVFEHLASLGHDWSVNPSNGGINLANDLGIDYAALPQGGPVITEGRIVSGGKTKRTVQRTTWVFGEDSAGNWTIQQDSVGVAGLSARQKYLNAGDVDSVSTLIRAAINILDQEIARAGAVKTQHVRMRAGFPDLDTAIPTPLLQFDVGDTILLDLIDDQAGASATKEEYPDGFRCQRITVRMNEEQEDYQVDWSYAELEESEAEAAALRRLLEAFEIGTAPGSSTTGGGAGSGGGGGAVADHTHVQGDITDLTPLEVGDAAGGDLTGTYPSPTVDGLIGVPIVGGPTVDGQVPTYDLALNQLGWNVPSSGGGGGSQPYQSFLEDRTVIGQVVDGDDDEFDDGTFDAAWTQVIPTGTIGITEDLSKISCVMAGQASNDCVGLLKPIPAGAYTTIEIEIAYQIWMRSVNYLMIGPVFADGVLTSSNVAWQMTFWTGGEHDLRSGTFANINNDHNAPGGSSVNSNHPVGHLHARFTWETGLGVRQQWSPDGISFSDFGGGFVAGTTLGLVQPTHYGIGLSTWGSSEDHLASIEYFRVTRTV